MSTTPLSDSIKRALLENEKYMESIEAKLSAAETALADQTAENARLREALIRVIQTRDAMEAANPNLRQGVERLSRGESIEEINATLTFAKAEHSLALADARKLTAAALGKEQGK